MYKSIYIRRFATAFVCKVVPAFADGVFGCENVHQIELSCSV